MKRASRWTATTVAGILVVASMVTAEIAPELPPMVVSADRGGKTEEDIAANTTVLTGAEIRAAGYTTLVDGLRNAGGLHVRSTSGNPSTAEISMRGFGENSHGRVLVLINGRRLNRPDMAWGS